MWTVIGVALFILAGSGVLALRAYLRIKEVKKNTKRTEAENDIP